MRVLVIGDVVARPGRVAVVERIRDLREQHAVDLAVMNAENVAGRLVEATEDGLLLEQAGGETVAIAYRRMQGIEPLLSG